MMRGVVSRSAVRRIQHHVARKQIEARRFLGSATYEHAAGGGRGQFWNNLVVAHPADPTSNTNFVVAKRRYGSSNNSNDDDNGRLLLQGASELRMVYVHPLSQVVLEYLQDYHHSWVVSKGLDRSLVLHRDGSFEAKYVPLSSSSTPPPYNSPTYSPLPRIPPPSNNDKKECTASRDGRAEPMISSSTSATAVAAANQTPPGGNTNTNTNTNSKPVPSSSNDNHNARKYDAATKGRFADIAATETNNMRIWTSYDEQEKKHWLTVRKGLFRQRFLLQDNLLSAWQGNRGTSIPERIHVAVDEMIRAVDRMEQQQQSPNAMMGHPQQRQQKGQSRSRKR